MTRANAPAEVRRLGRRPDPWAWPDWAYAEPDGTFGNRYDDPQGVYRVLYASTQRVATFVECLAYYRADIELLAELQAIVGDEGDEEPPAPSTVPTDWVEQRCVGRAALVGDYADVGHHESLAELRTALAARVVHHGLHDLNAATLRSTASPHTPTPTSCSPGSLPPPGLAPPASCTESRQRPTPSAGACATSLTGTPASPTTETSSPSPAPPFPCSHLKEHR